MGEAICASPCDESSAGATQLPAPPRPVCRYSGKGWEAARAFARSFVLGCDSRSAWDALSVS